MDENSLKKSLAGMPVSQIRYFPEIGSTNDEALSWASQGAPDASMVIANHQTSGRGRLGRRWVTRPGSSLAFSLILHPSSHEMDNITLFSPLAAIALCQVMNREYQLDSKIKWPNDVLIHSRKVCGILVESNWLGDHVQGVIIGTGINVLQGSVPSDETLLYPATSIEEEFHHPVEREKILRSFLNQFFHWRPQLGSELFYELYKEKLAYINQSVVVIQPGMENKQGIILGISNRGDLLLKTGDEKVIHVKAGDLHLRPVSPDNTSIREETHV